MTNAHPVMQPTVLKHRTELKPLMRSQEKITSTTGSTTDFTLAQSSNSIPNVKDAAIR